MSQSNIDQLVKNFNQVNYHAFYDLLEEEPTMMTEDYIIKNNRKLGIGKLDLEQTLNVMLALSSSFMLRKLHLFEPEQ